MFALLPKRALDAVVAAMFLLGVIYGWREAARGQDRLDQRSATREGAILTAFVVIFLAEWGDLTQILTANLAAKYHAPLSVAVGATLALWAVAGLAVASGQSLLRYPNIVTIRKVTVVVLLIITAYTAWLVLQ